MPNKKAARRTEPSGAFVRGRSVDNSDADVDHPCLNALKSMEAGKLVLFHAYCNEVATPEETTGVVVVTVRNRQMLSDGDVVHAGITKSVPPRRFIQCFG